MALPSPAHVHSPLRFSLQVHRDLHVASWAAAVDMTGNLRRALAAGARARLLASGSPQARTALSALARAPLDWGRIDVGLTDERWLRPDDPDSAAAAVRDALRGGYAREARLEPLTALGRRLEDAVAVANAHAQQAPCSALLALHDDGGLAALRPAALGLQGVLDARQAVMAIDAPDDTTGSPWARALTLTPAGLAGVGDCVVVARGSAQRHWLDAAHGGDVDAAGVLGRVASAGASLRVHWCP